MHEEGIPAPLVCTFLKAMKFLGVNVDIQKGTIREILTVDVLISFNNGFIHFCRIVIGPNDLYM